MKEAIMGTITAGLLVLLLVLFIHPKGIVINHKQQQKPVEVVIDAQYKITVYSSTDSYLDEVYYSNEILETRNSYTVTFLKADNDQEMTFIGAKVKIEEIMKQ